MLYVFYASHSSPLHVGAMKKVDFLTLARDAGIAGTTFAERRKMKLCSNLNCKHKDELSCSLKRSQVQKLFLSCADLSLSPVRKHIRSFTAYRRKETSSVASPENSRKGLGYLNFVKLLRHMFMKCFYCNACYSQTPRTMKNHSDAPEEYGHIASFFYSRCA